MLPESNCNSIFYDILSNLFLTSGSLEVSNFVHILLRILKEQLHLLDENQIVIYNKNHIKHFQTLPWWFKSNVLTAFISQELDDNDPLNKPVKMKRKLDQSENDLEDERESNERLDPLAKYCENSKKRVVEVYSTSKDIENHIQTQQLQNDLLQKRLNDALSDEVDLIKEDI